MGRTKRGSRFFCLVGSTDVGHWEHLGHWVLECNNTCSRRGAPKMKYPWSHLEILDILDILEQVMLASCQTKGDRRQHDKSPPLADA